MTPSPRTPASLTRRLLVAAAALGLVAAACGSDDDAAPAEEPADEPAEEPAEEPADEPAAEPAEEPAEEPADEAVGDGAFPVTIEHKFGETTIEAEPERVVSIGYNEHDFLLALDVIPVGLRDWYGEQPNSVWPWAQDELGDATPEVLPSGALNFEQIAALDPDLIVGVWSGMTEDDYALLTDIAPVVAQPDTYDDYGTPWQEQTLILGRAVGKEAEAEAIVAEVEADIVAAREAHPEWEGLTASVAFWFEDAPGAYTSQDTRSRFMQDLGFTIPEVNDSGGEESFFLTLSPEDISALDVDALVWITSTQEEITTIIDGLPTRPSLTAVLEGREIFTGDLLTGAFSHSSPLSLDYVVEAMVVELEAAVDGDPSTPTPSSVRFGVVEAPEGFDAGDGADTAAELSGDEATVAAAWAAVFDSTVGFDGKAANLEGADELADTIEAYTAAGESFGGINLAPTAVVIDGDAATITYDVYFGENPAYSELVGEMSLVDGVWTVSRDEFCSFMTSARVGCAG